MGYSLHLSLTRLGHRHASLALDIAQEEAQELDHTSWPPRLVWREWKSQLPEQVHKYLHPVSCQLESVARQAKIIYEHEHVDAQACDTLSKELGDSLSTPSRNEPRIQEVEFNPNQSASTRIQQSALWQVHVTA